MVVKLWPKSRGGMARREMQIFPVRWPANIHKNTPLPKIRRRICRIGNSKAAFADLSFRAVESELQEVPEFLPKRWLHSPPLTANIGRPGLPKLALNAIRSQLTVAMARRKVTPVIARCLPDHPLTTCGQPPPAVRSSEPREVLGETGSGENSRFGSETGTEVHFRQKRIQDECLLSQEGHTLS